MSNDGGGSGEQLARVALIISAVALALSILGLFLPLGTLAAGRTASGGGDEGADGDEEDHQRAEQEQGQRDGADPHQVGSQPVLRARPASAPRPWHCACRG